MVLKPFMSGIVKTAREPMIVIKSKGLYPSPNHNTAKGSKEIPGIGLSIETKVSKTILNPLDCVAIELTASETIDDAPKATNRRVRLPRIEPATKLEFSRI